MMSAQLQTESKVPIGKAFTLVPTGILQRKCACGSHSMAGGECEECAKKKGMLQRKLAIGASNDPLEQEADRVAAQVMSAPLNSKVNAISPRIQRFSGQVSDGMATTPPSVDRVLAGSGKPLEPAIREDMESRFGHDFSQVRVHSGRGADQSARDMNARAYTVGHNVVFGADQFAPGTGKGRRLLAHELAHVVQQSGAEANVVRRSNGFEDEPTLEWKRAGTIVEPSPPGSPRGVAHRPGGSEHANVVKGEIKTGTRPTGGGGGAASEGKAATTKAKMTRSLESVAELGRIGALDAALFYLQIHAAHFEALENVSKRVEVAKGLLNNVAEFENGARALRNAVNELQRAEAALPEVTTLIETGEQSASVIVSVGELEYIEVYANSAASIVGKAFDARVKLNKIIIGWDAVVAQGEEARDFTRKAVVEAVQILDFRFQKEKGGSFRGFLIEARDDAGRVESWARSKWYYAKDILDSANLPLRKAMNEAASIRADLMAMAKRGSVSAGVLVAIDYLKVAQGANDSAVVLQAVKRSLSVLHGISGVSRQTARLRFLQIKLEALMSGRL